MFKSKEKRTKTSDDQDYLDNLLKEANKVNVKELMSNSLFDKAKKGVHRNKKGVSKKNKHTKKYK